MKHSQLSEQDNDKFEEITNNVFAVLYDRKGFDDWWDDIDIDTRTEILVELQEVIKSMVLE
jgi:hypothetical protein